MASLHGPVAVASVTVDGDWSPSFPFPLPPGSRERALCWPQEIGWLSPRVRRGLSCPASRYWLLSATASDAAHVACADLWFRLDLTLYGAGSWSLWCGLLLLVTCSVRFHVGSPCTLNKCCRGFCLHLHINARTYTRRQVGTHAQAGRHARTHIHILDKESLLFTNNIQICLWTA